MTIALLATGDELTHGDTLNTTSQVLAESLSGAGYPMGMHLVCGDKEAELVESIQFLAAHHKTLIITGGLGPTSDDRTRFALAHYLETPLVSYPEALQAIEARLAARQFKVSEAQATQALFPEGAYLLPNPLGTAMGCAYASETHVFVLLPGPPKECLPMFEDYAFPYLKERLTPSDKLCLKWRLFGVAEGIISEQLEAALTGVSCQVGYRLARDATPPYLEFKVRCHKDQVPAIQEIIEPFARRHASH